MKLGVLGALTVDGIEVADLITAAKPRSVLATLAMTPGRGVSTAALMRELWDQRPPRSASTTLQTYVLHLRGMFRGLASRADGGDSPLVTRSPGYLLDTHGVPGDLDDYEHLSTQGHEAIRDERWDKAHQVLSQALELWRGDPLSDIRPGPVLYPQVCGLEESRLSVTEMRIEADLRLGQHHQVQRDLAVLAADHPLHEGIRVKQMIALFLSGQVAAALAVFQDYRRHLVDELGIDPSPRVHAVQRAMLSADPSTNVPGLFAAMSATPLSAAA